MFDSAAAADNDLPLRVVVVWDLLGTCGYLCSIGNGGK
jgi:hypothetical protein